MNNHQYTTTIGIDLGDKLSAICVLDAEGEVMDESKIRTTTQAFTHRFESMDPTRIIMETGTHSRWLYHLLSDFGHEVIVADARRLWMIFANENKTDRCDAHTLARVARFDTKLLCQVQHRSHKAHQDLALIKARAFLVDERTRLIVHIRSVVKTFGERLPSCDAAYFHKNTRDHLPQALKEALDHFYDILETLDTKIKHYDTQITTLSQESYPETQLMRSIHGVGPITSLTFALLIEDPYRFRKSRDIGSYFGLRPRLSQSGASNPQLSITKCGNSMMRQLLVQSAHHILGRYGADCDLRRFGLRIAERGGAHAKKRAVIAVARKLSILLHRLWIDGEIYDPFHNAKLRGETIPTP